LLVTEDHEMWSNLVLTKYTHSWILNAISIFLGTNKPYSLKGRYFDYLF